MQTVGSACRICHLKIVSAADGCWCAPCKSVFHRQCMTAAQEVCPTCRRTRDRGEDHVVHARFCTDCLTLHQQPQPICRSCGRRMIYDTPEDYERQVLLARRHSRRNLILGGLMTFAGPGLFAAFATGNLVLRLPLPIALPLVVGATVFVAGVRMLRIGFVLRRFE